MKQEPIKRNISLEELLLRIEKLEFQIKSHNHNKVGSEKLSATDLENLSSIDHGTFAGLDDDDHIQYYKSGREPDHGALGGLTDDDHAQYIKKDGTRAFTGTGDGFKDEDDMASDSATAAPSQQSVKAFVENRIIPTKIIIDMSLNNTGSNYNSFVRQLFYGEEDFYWAISPTVSPNQGWLGWADQPSGFYHHFTHKIVNGDANNMYGLCIIGTDVFVSDEGSLNDISRYDAKTFANREDWGFNGTATKGQMAYDGSTYIYIIDKDYPNRARRYTIDDVNNDLVQDTGWVTLPENYKTLPESLHCGFWCDGTYFYGYDTGDNKFYQITISNLTVANSVTVDSNIEESYEKGFICGIAKIGTQMYAFYDIQEKTDSNYNRPKFIVGYPFDF